MPFKSKAQHRWAFATKQPFARRWAKKGVYKGLPAKKGRKGKKK
jgi:hypothetical protein